MHASVAEAANPTPSSKWLGPEGLFITSVVTLHVTFGRVVSTTCTLVPHFAPRFEPSVTEQLTGVVPSG